MMQREYNFEWMANENNDEIILNNVLIIIDLNGQLNEKSDELRNQCCN